MIARSCSSTSSGKPSAADLKLALDFVTGVLSIYSSPPLVESLTHSNLYAALWSAMTALIAEVRLHRALFPVQKVFFCGLTIVLVSIWSKQRNIAWQVKLLYDLNTASLVGSLRAFWTYGTSTATYAGAPQRGSPQTLQGSSQRRSTYQPPQRRAQHARLSGRPLLPQF